MDEVYVVLECPAGARLGFCLAPCLLWTPGTA